MMPLFRHRRVTSAAVALAMQLTLVPLTARAQPADTRDKILLVGIGAVAGVLAFNLLSAPMGTVPYAGGVLEAVPESIALGSRMIAVLSAGSGALGGLWLYDRSTGQQSNYGYFAALLAGAAAGVAAGNYLSTGTLGTLPTSVGAGAAEAAVSMATSTAQAASRVYVVGTAAIGTWAADWLYRR